MVCARTSLRIVLVVFVLCLVSGCGVHLHHLPEGSILGRQFLYDYSPTVIRTGSVVKVWWCGTDYNPYDITQYSDSIQYESIDLSTNKKVGPFAVLGETQYAWDSVYTCNPKVVQGQFVNPLGNNKTYTYAMYYVALGTTGTNSIGVAFSNDGLSWKKYPKPIINPVTDTGYGVGQPAVVNLDHKANVFMIYESYDYYVHHIVSVTTDGVHFTDQGNLTTNGLNPHNPQPSWGDMAFDPLTGYWYAAFMTYWRDPNTTGGVVERGQYGIELFRIPQASIQSGATPWEWLTNIDTNLTGYEANFIPSFVRDPYGNLNVGVYPAMQLYTSIANPIPPWNATPEEAGNSGSIADWDIGTATWTPGQPLRTLNRYANASTHETTTGYIDPTGGFMMEKTLGHIYEGPQQGATVALYGCKRGSTDYFVSLDYACEGERILGIQGFGYAQPVSGQTLVPLYACSTSTDHFVSNDSGCEGQQPGKLLGYALP